LVATSAITEISGGSAVAPTKIVLDDHDFLKPALKLAAEQTRTGAPALEYYDHPAGHRTPAAGSARAKALKEAFDVEAAFVEATAHAFEIAAGTQIEITDSDVFDAKWSVRRVRHRWQAEESGTSYDNELVLFAEGVPFRPRPRACRPFMRGPQIAVVTGPSGEDVHTDEHGRVKVRFPWDRRAKLDDTSSGWVRVMQLSMSGAIAIPRVGWEVLVEFENGDPDRPIVVGRLYNARYLPPYSLPEHRTVTALASYSSPGRDGENLVRIDDANGSQRFRVHAQKDMSVTVTENMTETVAKSESVGVVGKQTIVVKGDQTITVDKDHELRIGGKQTWTVKGTRTAKVKGEETFTVSKDHALTVAAAHERTTQKSDTIAIGGKLSETIGAALTMKASKEIRWLVAGDANLTVGAASTEKSDEGRSELVIGARSDTVGAAEILSSGKDLSIRSKGDRSMTVGAALAYTAGTLQIGSADELSLTIGAALALTGASAIVLKAGSSTVTISGGAIVFKSSKIKLTATGPHAQVAGVVADK
jgi:type VI secretion system secreted protein VgrG